MKHGGGNIRDCGFFAVSGPIWLAIIDGPMSSGMYQQILQDYVRESIYELKVKCKLVIVQYKCKTKKNSV